MKKYAVIVAAGSGKRMGSEIPKQFLELAGRPVLMHSIGQFTEYDDTTIIIVVLPQEQIPYWKSLSERYSFGIPHIIVKGGDKRFHSVRNGLEMVDAPGLVAIHDGVRPLVSKDTIRRCFEAAGKKGSAIPVISPADSIRMVTGQGSVSVNRLHVKMVQTPQVFDANLIKKAYLQEYSDDFTDDATVLERAGETVFLVEGNPENIKITTPEDLLVAKTLFPTIS
jgi:2-C-methyl-D-erythritol 4-phosphate cytidylyltransferase